MRSQPTSGISLTRGLSIGRRFASSRLFVAGAVAVIASAIATLVIREVTVQLVDVPTSFSPASPIERTLPHRCRSGGATAACFALNARSTDPVRLFVLPALGAERRPSVTARVATGT